MFDIGDESDTHHAIIDQGDVVLPIVEPTPPPGRVDRLLDFWNSFSNYEASGSQQGQLSQRREPEPQQAASSAEQDARDRKIAELQAQLQELERKTRPTKTSPGSSHHSVKAIQSKPDHHIPIPKVMRPPGLDSEFGTPQGSNSDLLGLDNMPAPAGQLSGQAWELDLDGLDENAINLRILKKIDRAEVQQHRQNAMSSTTGHSREAQQDSHNTKRSVDMRREPDIDINDGAAFPEMKMANQVKKSKKKPPSPPSSPPTSDSPTPTSSDDGHDDQSQRRPIPVLETRAPVNSKVKEKDLKFAVLPDAPDFDAWKDAAYHKIVAAAQRGYTMLPWISKVEEPEVTFEQLADSEGYETLDSALCAAINDAARGDLREELSIRSQELRRRGTLMTGRQALYVVYSFYEIDADRGALYDLSDFMSGTFRADKDMQNFLQVWTRTVQGLSEPQPQNNVRTLLFEQLQKAQALKPDIEAGHPLLRPLAEEP